ncbi:MAG: hypothetical protein KC492_10890, partial [Myxococcales bacterium]|nr:hypothetical protein [Myxococcales bacterium]
MKPVAFKSAQAQRDVHARYGQALADWPAAYEERRIATAWGETFALVSGPTTAPPLILLHGAQSNALSWAFDV